MTVEHTKEAKNKESSTEKLLRLLKQLSERLQNPDKKPTDQHGSRKDTRGKNRDVPKETKEGVKKIQQQLEMARGREKSKQVAERLLEEIRNNEDPEEHGEKTALILVLGAEAPADEKEFYAKLAAEAKEVTDRLGQHGVLEEAGKLLREHADARENTTHARAIIEKTIEQSKSLEAASGYVTKDHDLRNPNLLDPSTQTPQETQELATRAIDKQAGDILRNAPGEVRDSLEQALIQERHAIITNQPPARIQEVKGQVENAVNSIQDPTSRRRVANKVRDLEEVGASRARDTRLFTDQGARQETRRALHTDRPRVDTSVPRQIEDQRRYVFSGLPDSPEVQAAIAQSSSFFDAKEEMRQGSGGALAKEYVKKLDDMISASSDETQRRHLREIRKRFQDVTGIDRYEMSGNRIAYQGDVLTGDPYADLPIVQRLEAAKGADEKLVEFVRIQEHNPEIDEQIRTIEKNSGRQLTPQEEAQYRQEMKNDAIEIATQFSALDRKFAKYRDLYRPGSGGSGEDIIDDEDLRHLFTLLNRMDANFGDGTRERYFGQYDAVLKRIREHRYPPQNRMTIHWEEVIQHGGGTISADLENERRLRFARPEDRDHFTFSSELSSRIQNPFQDQDKWEEWFGEFFRDRAVQLKQEIQFDWHEQAMINDYFNFLGWRFGKEVERKARYDFSVRLELHQRYRVLFAEATDDESLFKILAYTPDILKHMRTAEYSNIAIPLWIDELTNLMADKKQNYYRLEKSRPDRDKRIKEIEAQLLRGGPHSVSGEITQEYLNLLGDRYQFNQGAMLWDSDILYDETLHAQLVDKKKKQEHALSMLVTRTNLSAEERQRYLLDLQNNALTVYQKEYIEHHRIGFSFIDMRVARKMQTYLAIERGIKPEDISLFKIQRALQYAAAYHLLKGNAPQVAAMHTIIPPKEAVPYRLTSHAWERWVRIINPMMFEDRFYMAGMEGDLARSMWAIEQLEMHQNFSLHNMDQWKEATRKVYEEKMRHFREKHEDYLKIKRLYDKDPDKYEHEFERLKLFAFPEYGIGEALLAAAEVEFGMPSKYLLISNEPIIGGSDQLSYWRMGRNLAEPYFDYYRAKGIVPGDWMLPVYKFHTASSLEDKKKYMGYVAKRMPIVATHFDPRILDQIQEAFPNLDIRLFKDALTAAQQRLVINVHEGSGLRNYAEEDVDIGQSSIFDDVVTPFLRGLVNGDRASYSQATRDRINRGEVGDYLGATQKLQELFKDKIENYRWAEFDFPITISSSFYDIQVANDRAEGVHGAQRRYQSDTAASYKAMEIARSFRTKNDFMFPQKPEDALHHIQELAHAHEAYIGRVGKHGAERRAEQHIRYLINHNMWKGRDTWLAWMPGGKEIMLRSNKLQEDSRYSSNAIMVAGPLSNSWGASSIYNLLLKSQDMGILTREQVKKLARDYGADLKGRTMERVRKYWWLGPLALGFILFKMVEEASKEHSK